GRVDDGLVGDRLGIVAQSEPLGARERPDDEIHLFLLDQAARLAHRGVRRGVRGPQDPLDLLAIDLMIIVVQGHLEAADAVITWFGKDPFLWSEQTNLDAVGHGRSRNQNGDRGDRRDQMLLHRLFLPDPARPLAGAAVCTQMTIASEHDRPCIAPGASSSPLWPWDVNELCSSG